MPKKRTRWELAYDHEKITPLHRGFKLSCCDCGSTHSLNFKITKHNGKPAVQFVMKKLDRVTNAMRSQKEVQHNIQRMVRYLSKI